MSAGETVVVACKLPHGMICELGTLPVIKRWKLNGANTAQIIGVNPLVSQFGITTNVNKDDMEQWLKLHADLPFMKTGAIFIQKDTRSADAEAKEKQTSIKSGLEPLNPREMPKGVGIEVPPGQRSPV